MLLPVKMAQGNKKFQKYNLRLTAPSHARCRNVRCATSGSEFGWHGVGLGAWLWMDRQRLSGIEQLELAAKLYAVETDDLAEQPSWTDMHYLDSPPQRKVAEGKLFLNFTKRYQEIKCCCRQHEAWRWRTRTGTNSNNSNMCTLPRRRLQHLQPMQCMQGAKAKEHATTTTATTRLLVLLLVAVLVLDKARASPYCHLLTHKCFQVQ